MSLCLFDHICLKNIWMTELAYENMIHGIKYYPVSWYIRSHGNSTYHSKIHKAYRVKQWIEPWNTDMLCTAWVMKGKAFLYVIL